MQKNLTSRNRRPSEADAAGVEGISNLMPSLCRLLTEQQVSEITGLSVRTLQDWRYKKTPNKPPYVQPSRGLVRYPETHLVAWLESQLVVH